MEDDMYDTHLCLVCNQTIVGLLNYVFHKKNQCGSKKQTDMLPEPQHQDQTFRNQLSSESRHLHTSLLLSHGHDQNVGPTSMLPEIGPKEFNHSPLMFSQGQAESYTQSLQTSSECSFTSATAGGTLTTSSSGNYTGFEPCQGLSSPSKHLEQLFPSTSLQIHTTIAQDSLPCTLAMPSNPLPPSLASESAQTVPPSTCSEITSPTLSFSSQEANQNTQNSLSVDVNSPLSRFINANLSPIAGASVDPNSVMPASSGHCEDFFQSLELQSRGTQQKSPNSLGKDSVIPAKSFEAEDHADIDLPISKILSTLDFSSDEDMVDFPSEDDLDIQFDEYLDEDGDHPPKSHTGGKWTPGQGPQHRHHGKKMKWRLGAGPIRHGGKWRPGMSYGKHGPATKGKQISPVSKGKQGPGSIGKQIEEKNYSCGICDVSFENRFLYSNHFGSKSHKEKLAQEAEKIKAADQKQESGQEFIENVAVKQIHECTICEKTFARKQELAKHLVTNFHRNRAVNSPEAIDVLHTNHKLALRFCPFQCRLCSFYFNRQSDFLMHIDSQGHLGECENSVGQLLCVTCKFKTKSATSLSDHLKGTEHERTRKSSINLCIVRECVKEMKCQYCGMTMYNKKRMKRHIAYRHPKKQVTKPYVRTKGGHHPACTECGKVCVSPSQLIVHIRRNHTKEKPYKCDPCKKSFSVFGALNSHYKSKTHESKLRELSALEVFDRAVQTKFEDQSESEISPDEDKNEDSVHHQTEDHRRTDGIDNTSATNENNNFVNDNPLIGFISPETDPGSKDSGIDKNFLPNKGEWLPKPRSKGNMKVKQRGILRNRKEKNAFKCEHCDTIHEKYDQLREHCNIEHRDEVHYCNLCSANFLSQKAYRIHCAGRFHQNQMDKNKEMTSDVLYKCSICDMKFVDERWRNFHYEFQHNHVNSEDDVRRINQGNDKVTQLYGDHLKLLEDLPRNTSLSCPECGKFLKKEHLVEHLRLHTGEKPFTCRFCEKSFVAKLSLRRHLMVHMGLTENTCDICGREFKKIESFQAHMEQHKREKEGDRCICDVCGMVFTLKKQVEMHMKRHGERKFKCLFEGCTWTFVMKNELKMHMLSHTKEKKFLCDICGFAATTKHRLHRHVKTHSGVRDYHCSYCTYKAGCNTHLRRHMRIHIGAKPFKCPYCPYTCNTHENVRKHIAKTKKHYGLKIYPCKFCSFGTNTGNEFRDHLLKCHPDEMKGEKLDCLSVFSGLYVRKDDPAKPEEGTKIVPVKERPPRPQKNALFANVKSIRGFKHDTEVPGSQVLFPDAVNHISRPIIEQPICNIESYWSNDPVARNWFPASDAANTLSALNSEQCHLYTQPVSSSEFLVNVAHTPMSGPSSTYHEGSVANVVVVASDY